MKELLKVRFRLGELGIVEENADGEEDVYQTVDEMAASFGDHLKSLVLTDGQMGDVLDIKVVRVKEQER